MTPGADDLFALLFALGRASHLATNRRYQVRCNTHDGDTEFVTDWSEVSLQTLHDLEAWTEGRYA